MGVKSTIHAALPAGNATDGSAKAEEMPRAKTPRPAARVVNQILFLILFIDGLQLFINDFPSDSVDGDMQPVTPFPLDNKRTIQGRVRQRRVL